MKEELGNGDIEGEGIKIGGDGGDQWGWRMEVRVEEVVKEKELKERMGELIEERKGRQKDRMRG